MSTSTKFKFTGQVLECNLGGNRKYTIGAIRFAKMKEVVAPKAFDPRTGEGEQRFVIQSHANFIRDEMKEGRYAPTPFTFGTRASHRNNIVFDNGNVSLEVDSEDKLALLDGGNRSAALDMLRAEGGATAKIIDDLFIPYILYLDGDPRKDFVALQAGKPVDKNHVLSVRIASGLLDEEHAPYYNMAKEVAEQLHTRPDSFCHNIIQFHSKASSNKLPLSLNGLCPKSEAELAYSLYGGAKIAAKFGKDADWLTNCILTVHQAIKDDPDGVNLLEPGNILSPAPDGTTVGTNMLIALGNALACRLLLKQLDKPRQEDVDLVVACAINNLSVPTTGKITAAKKRAAYHEFCEEFFYDLGPKPEDNDDNDGELDIPKNGIGMHEGIPVIIIRLLSAKTFNVSKLPSETKRGRKPKVQAVVADAVIRDDEDNIITDVSIVKDSVNDPDAEAFVEEDQVSREALSMLEQEAEVEEAETNFENLDNDLDTDDSNELSLVGSTVTVEELAPWDEQEF